jgi:peroxiredoxin-like protein
MLLWLVQTEGDIQVADLRTYTVVGQWTGNRGGTGELALNQHTVQFSVPGELGGAGVGTNPEQLLLSAAASCYLITLAILLTNRNIPYQRIELETEGLVENDSGLRLDRIEHRPVVFIEQGQDEASILTLAEHAELTCMVSCALRGNVKIKVRPRVVCQATSR